MKVGYGDKHCERGGADESKVECGEFKHSCGRGVDGLKVAPVKECNHLSNCQIHVKEYDEVQITWIKLVIGKIWINLASS